MNVKASTLVFGFKRDFSLWTLSSKLVRKEEVEGAGFMCALLMPLMCFPRHPLSNYFAKGQEVLSSISKQPHLPSTIWNLVITSKSHKEKNIQSRASDQFENDNIFLHNWNIFYLFGKAKHSEGICYLFKNLLLQIN